jgi:hypothetical protein
MGCPVLNIFPHCLKNGTIFRKKITGHKMFFFIFSTIVSNSSHSKKNLARYDKTDNGLHIKCPLFLSDFSVSWIFSQIFEKFPIIKVCENPSIGSRVFPCGQTDGHMTKLVVVFHNFGKALNKCSWTNYIFLKN